MSLNAVSFISYAVCENSFVPLLSSVTLTGCLPGDNQHADIAGDLIWEFLSQGTKERSGVQRLVDERGQLQ